MKRITNADRRARHTSGSGMHLGPATPTEAYNWTGTRRHGNKRGTDTKGQGEWRTVSPNYSTVTTRDARWSA